MRQFSHSDSLRKGRLAAGEESRRIRYTQCSARARLPARGSEERSRSAGDEFKTIRKKLMDRHRLTAAGGAVYVCRLSGKPARPF